MISLFSLRSMVKSRLQTKVDILLWWSKIYQHRQPVTYRLDYCYVILNHLIPYICIQLNTVLYTVYMYIDVHHVLSTFSSVTRMSTLRWRWAKIFYFFDKSSNLMVLRITKIYTQFLKAFNRAIHRSADLLTIVNDWV